MKLEYFYIKGFRRIQEAKIICGDATFLIGENNIGKSSVLKAMNIFFSEQSKLESEDFFKVEEKNYQVTEVILEAKFSSLPDDANNWRGFKGRIVNEEINGENTQCIYYKKTFPKNGTVKREMKALSKSVKEEFTNCKSLNHFIEKGISEDLVNETFGADYDKTKTIPAKEKEKFESFEDIWDYNENESSWINNPGGIEGNISIRLPKFLSIPAESKKEDIEGSGGILQKTMKELFEDVRDTSENYKEAQKYLDLLSKELDPNDENKEFGKMLKDVNGIIGGILMIPKYTLRQI